MNRLKELFATSEDVIYSIGIVFVALLVGLVIYRILFSILVRLTGRAGTPLRDIFTERLRGPARTLIPLLAIMLVWQSLSFPERVIEVSQHLISLCFIAGIAWLFINATLAGRDIIMSRYDIEVNDDLKARAIHTQLTVLAKIITVVVIIITVAAMLMTFSRIRHVGTSILASAGIIGIVLGAASQRSISTLIAGMQIAFTQPIRINDVVIVEGEWGWIEEITLTYVVVKVWDLRRLVVPVSYFLEKPFQNWTRASTNLLGTVFLYTHHAVPVEEVRRKLHEILQESDNWDKEAWGLQVTNSTYITMELRALMSAANSSAMSNLRCEVREKLLAFLAGKYPSQYLPPWEEKNIFSRT